MTALPVQVWGEGVPVVLVHGSIATGEESWEAQRPLADQGYQLLVPDRRAYRPTAGSDEGEDYVQDGDDIAELIGDGAHLVGHSYGGLAAMFAAAKRAEAVHSLTVVEPPAFGLRRDEPAIVEFITGFDELAANEQLGDREFLEAFLGLVGEPPEEFPEEMLEQWTHRVRALRRGRATWEVDPPLDELAAASFPKLVISGGHHRAFDAACDEIERGLGADRRVITGAGHEVQMMAEPFNQALLELWSSTPSR